MTSLLEYLHPLQNFASYFTKNNGSYITNCGSSCLLKVIAL